MSADRTKTGPEHSRRSLLHLALAGGGLLIAATISTTAWAGSKIAKKAVKYQDTPKAAARCDVCGQWQGPSACKVVDGLISPSGWCSIYVPK